MNNITINKNNLYSGECKICGIYNHNVNEIRNKGDKCTDEPTLKICNNCIKEIMCLIVNEYS